MSKSSIIKIKIIGVGGGGGNAVHRMSKNLSEGNSFLAINTDIQALENIQNIQTFAIGPNITKGMGTGGNPEIGKKSIKESYKQIEELIKGYDMVFITAGMGGGTGTGASSIIAEMCKKNGRLSIGIVTLPFSFEGEDRRKIAIEEKRTSNKLKLDLCMGKHIIPYIKERISYEKRKAKRVSIKSTLRSGIETKY